MACRDLPRKGELAPRSYLSGKTSVLLHEMYCGISRRTPPPGPAFVRRLALFVCLLALCFGPAAAPASAYVCAPPVKTQTRTLASLGAAQKDCERPTARPKRGNADAMSFVFFIGILIAVVLVPVALGRREDLPPE
jgi:hypothetical protein